MCLGTKAHIQKDPGILLVYTHYHWRGAWKRWRFFSASSFIFLLIALYPSILEKAGEFVPSAWFLAWYHKVYTCIKPA